jgi:hypothetical protein
LGKLTLRMLLPVLMKSIIFDGTKLRICSWASSDAAPEYAE